MKNFVIAILFATLFLTGCTSDPSQVKYDRFPTAPVLSEPIDNIGGRDIFVVTIDGEEYLAWYNKSYHGEMSLSMCKK